MEVLLIYVTCPSREVAESLGKAVVEQRLAACYNAWQIQSFYWWENATNQEDEWVILLKTRPELESPIESVLLASHPYEVPCILRWSAKVNQDYGEWIYRETKPGN
ncbi:MAG: divalent-cation tolerance protein CutA [Saprospiraceae bacterium]|nr:divalent-cation tolerance protein CutA [Saprospiraceae bacterium]